MEQPVKKIRVLIVDDSALFRNAMRTYIAKDPRFEVVGCAVDAEDARRQIERSRPDVVTMDVEMPRMSGIELLKVLLPKYPVPVVMVSSLSINVFDALSAGAVDFVRKPEMNQKDAAALFFKEIVRKIVVASHANVRVKGESRQEPPSAGSRLAGAMSDSAAVIALGASTGGTEATLTVLRGLPADTPGIVIVQHMPPGFTKMYAQRLDGICKMSVKEAEDGDVIQRGQVLIAPGDKQMSVVRSGLAPRYAVKCYDGEKVSGHCPSVDVLFYSVAKAAGKGAIGILLTGMGRDGAEGLHAMRKAGAYTIGQDKESSVVYGMPMVAYEIGAVAIQAPIDRIAGILEKQLGRNS